MKTGLTVAAIVATSFSALGGATSASAISYSKNQVNDKSSIIQMHNDKKESQAAIDLRAGLNTSLREHVTTNLVVNRGITAVESQAEIDAGKDPAMIKAAKNIIVAQRKEIAQFEAWLKKHPHSMK